MGSGKEEINRNGSIMSKMDYKGAKFEHLLMFGKFIDGLDIRFKELKQH